AISPSRTTEAATLGRRAACRSASMRSSSSGVDMCPESLRHELERALDVVVGEIEVRDGTQHAAPLRPRERDAVLAQPVERLLLSEPEPGDLELDEVGLDALELDRHATRDPALGEKPGAGVIFRKP